MEQVSTVGLDLAKHVFQAHGADASGAVVFRKKLRRGQVLQFFAALLPCTVAMETCAGAHHWGHEIGKLGHRVRLIAPSYVKPFVRRQKNDMADAEAICEAAQRPTMRFVAVKSEEAQAAVIVFRTRDLLVRQRTQATNALRGHLTEFGVITAKGPAQVDRLIAALDDPASEMPEAARAILRVLVEKLQALNRRVAELDREIARRAKEDAVARRLMTIPGVGAVTAIALVSLASPAEGFRRGRDFAAWRSHPTPRDTAQPNHAAPNARAPEARPAAEQTAGPARCPRDRPCERSAWTRRWQAWGCRGRRSAGEMRGTGSPMELQPSWCVGVLEREHGREGSLVPQRPVQAGDHDRVAVGR
jgi:transposase